MEPSNATPSAQIRNPGATKGRADARSAARALRRASFPHRTVLATRWSDNDQYGHVNNVQYYSWFDTAVNAMLIGAGLLDPDGGDVIGIVAETGCGYFAPLAFPQPIEVGVRVEHLGRRSVRYGLAVFDAANDEPAAVGHFVHVYVDRSTRRPLEALPPHWLGFLGSLQGARA